MTSFTDDALKSLNSYIKEINLENEGFVKHYPDMNKRNVLLSPHQIEALLARLKAAEQVCEHQHDNCTRKFTECQTETELNKAWRKAAGK